MRYTLLSFLIVQNLCISYLFCVATNRVNAQPTNRNIETIPVTNVRDLSDVKPTDWAYSTLQNLIQLYGYPQGYEDGTFRGNRTLSRYEFAAALHSFLVEILDSGRLQIAQDDLEILRRLQINFASELEVIRSRVDELDNRIGVVETNQFSPTTKLSGEVIFATTAAFGNDKAIPTGTITSNPEEIEDNVTLSDRVRLFFNTSFTGQDLLRVRLLAGNTQNLRSATGTNMARLSFDNDTNNQLRIDQLFYKFPLGKNIQITLMPIGTLFEVADPVNPLLGSDSKGSPFLFGVRSPIYREEIGGTGVGVSYDISSRFNFSIVYLAEDGEQPNPGSGLFNGAYSALGQLTWKPSSEAKVALVYSRSFNGIDINAGGQNTDAPFEDESQSITADSYGIVTNWQINSKVSIGGWAGWVRTQAQDLPDEPTAEILYYAATLAFPDLAKEGDLVGLVFGQPPRLINNEFPGIDEPDPAFNLEVFYRFPVSDRLLITPGLLVVFNPEHNNNNDTIYVGTIRTTFSF
ncbi:carbohydrate porin [Pleurocapsales cyanobacterium LEGE 06147]|nr:carbohydrate porin [Pleurocapsales cyanobacterium LEGE 06147]